MAVLAVWPKQAYLHCKRKLQTEESFQGSCKHIQPAQACKYQKRKLKREMLSFGAHATVHVYHQQTQGPPVMSAVLKKNWGL